MNDNYRRIAKAISYLEKNHREQPSLDEIAAQVHLSKFHFTRIFKRWAGVTPLQFIQFLTLEFSKAQLDAYSSVLDSAHNAGLSGPGRLHDLFVTFDAITPGEYKQQGQGLKINYGIHSSPFGTCLLAVTSRGICYLGFGDDTTEELLNDCFQRWPKATFTEDPQKTGVLVEAIFTSHTSTPSKPFHLLLKGTNFQIQVWKALLTLPRGQRISYQGLATLLGKPQAYRAVASGVAANPVGYLIPCHRVISKSGRLQKYRWGVERKKMLLGWEAARNKPQNSL